MTRDEAKQNLLKLVKSPNLIYHHYATEAAMVAIANYLQNKTKMKIDIEQWSLCGLLHDADYEFTKNSPERHTLYLEEQFGGLLAPEVMYAIKAHNQKYTGKIPQSNMDWALYTCDELTGFIIACALVQNPKSLKNVTVEKVMKKLSEKSFAKSVDRTQIAQCEGRLEINLPEYIGIVLPAMQNIANQIGFK